MSEPGFFDKVRAATGQQKPAPVRPVTGPAVFAGDISPYASTALNRELAALAGTPAGGRNHALNMAAFNLGQLVAGGELPAQLVLQELTRTAEAIGLEPSEIRATLNSALRSSEARPRQAPETDKEIEAWLNKFTAGPAHRAGSANGSTPGQPHPGGPPTPQNGAQPTSQNTPSGTFAGSTADMPASSTPPKDPGQSSSTSSSPIPQLPWLPPPPARPAPAGPNGSGNATPTAAPAAAATDTPAVTAEYLQPPAVLVAREAAVHLLQLQARAAAQRAFNQQNGAPVARPPAETLTQLLAQPDEPVMYRVHGLLPAGGRAVLAAQYKAGKSTMVANLIKSLADGDVFLDRFTVQTSDRITLIDDEMSKGQMRRWYRDHHIRNTDHVKMVSLRGALSAFDILDPVIRQQWARDLHGTEILILDCLRPVLDALGLDENKDGGKFLVAFDALLAEVGATEAIVVHHMGHGGQRSRGDSRILDWPDATWSMTRENVDDSKSARYFSAHGRDVNHPESLVEYAGDESRALRITGGSREQAKTDGLMEKLLAFVRLHPHQSGRQLADAMGASRKIMDAALARAVSEGKLVRYSGPKNAYQYTVRDPIPGQALPPIDPQNKFNFE